jgi:hypothetical protein
MASRSLLDSTISRRAFLGGVAGGLGTIALDHLLGRAAAASMASPTGAPHFAPRAKRVIYLTMNGGTSQLDLLDPKPKLRQHDGELCPDELFTGRKLAFIRERPKLLGSPYAFAQHGQSGIAVSELLPNFAQIVDDVTIVRSMHTDEFNHTPAELELLTGIGRFGRPSLGTWVAYGLGTENSDLPAFVALLCSPGQPPSGAASWGSAFLPSRYQGVEFRGVGEPVLYIGNPAGVSSADQRTTIDAVNALNEMAHERTQDAEIETRIAQYELAFRMQMSVPEATDIWREPPEVHAMYGTTPGKLSFANQCLLARRLSERGVRFVQLFLPGWDDHSSIFNLLPLHCKEVDRGMSALVRDLKQRGLLDDTLVVWASEFGRTPMAQDKNEGGARAAVGRDHQRDAFAIWMAGGGVKRGFVHGETDELGSSVVANPVHVHDFNATLLHLLGVDHKRLTYRHQGREFRVTDVAGEVVHDLIA